MKPTSCRAHPNRGSRRSVRVAYKTLHTNRCTVCPKQGLPNQCRRGRPEHSSFAAHGRYSFRPTRRGVAVSRGADASSTRSDSRGYDGSPGRQHSNYGPWIDMAARHSTHTHRHDEAQSSNHHRQPATHHRQPADHSDRDPARQARARLYRAKEATRYRHREHAVLASDDDDRAGPGSGDRQGEVA